jgi:hypothetical protein
MNKDIAERWTAALESGEYKQTLGCLNNSEGMCCLGVLTDLYLKEHGLSWEEKVPGSFTFERNANNLPPSVQHWAGMYTSYGADLHVEGVNGGVDTRETISLTELNDGDYYPDERDDDPKKGDPFSFAQIAQVIRDNVEVL